MILFATATVVSPPTARAQTAPLGAEAAQQADDLFKKGKDLYKSGKLREAYEAYRDAWALKQSYDIAANLANAELQLGMKPAAAEHLAFCIRNFPATGNQAQLAAVKSDFEEVRKAVGALVVRANVEGAEIFVDGASAGRAPLHREVFVMSGAHVVEARLSGYEVAKQDVVAALGPAHEVALVLVEAKPEPSGPNPADAQRPVGPGDGAATNVANAGNGAGGVRTAIVVGGGIAAGAALVAGVVLTVVANGKAAERDERAGWEHCYEAGPQAALPDCTEADSLRRDASGFGTAAFWSFMGAGAIGAATVAYAVVAPRGSEARQDRQARRVKVVPLVAVAGGGLGLSGRF